MKRLFVLGLTLLLGCTGDSFGPVPLAGVYALSTIDGSALPFTITVQGQPTKITAGELELSSLESVAVTLAFGDPGSPGFGQMALAGPYRLVTPDSIVFPLGPSPELFFRRTGSTIVMVTTPTGAVGGPALALGGGHRFTFTEQP